MPTDKSHAGNWANGPLPLTKTAKNSTPSYGNRFGSYCWTKFTRLLEREPTRPVVVDAALLVERGDPKKIVDVLVVVTAPESLRIQRTMARLGISRAEVMARLSAQLPEEDKVAVADFVVVNDKTPAVCRQRARAIWNKLQCEEQ